MTEPKTHSHSVDAEMAVLGAMMIEYPAAKSALLSLVDQDFYIETHRHIFNAISRLSEAESAIDLITVNESIREAGKIGEVGGLKFLTDCTNKVATAAHVEYYIRIVKGMSIERQIAVQLLVAQGDFSHDQLAKIEDLFLRRAGNGVRDLFDMRIDLMDALDELLSEKAPGLNSGFPKLDELLCGVEPGDLITIGGRTSGGKTALMTRWAVNASQEGEEVVYQTTEMKPIQMIGRILPMATGVPAWKLRRRMLSKEDRATIIQVAGDRLAPLPLMISGKSRITLDDIRGAIVRAGKPSWCFVDYLQRIRTPRGENRAYELEEVMIELKSMGQDLDTRMVVGAQLDRGLDKEPNKPPVLADFRGSAAIEHESDFALMLWTPPKAVLDKRFNYEPPPAGHKDIDVIIGKGRNTGAGATAFFTLNGEFIKMCEKETRQYDDEQARLDLKEAQTYEQAH